MGPNEVENIWIGMQLILAIAVIALLIFRKAIGIGHSRAFALAAQFFTILTIVSIHLMFKSNFRSADIMWTIFTGSLALLSFFCSLWFFVRDERDVIEQTELPATAFVRKAALFFLGFMLLVALILIIILKLTKNI